MRWIDLSAKLSSAPAISHSSALLRRCTGLMAIITLYSTGRADHDCAFKAWMTAAMVAASVLEAMRNLAPSISNSMPASTAAFLGERARRAFLGTDFSGDTTTASANRQRQAPSGFRESRRHVDHCCDVSP
ncbi:hypothetical protein [Mesorhizobium tianshanense]|nr:hypothetical protein [Mesorhizobium tianshanense]